MRAQDVLVVCRLLTMHRWDSFASLAVSVGLSASAAHSSVRRLMVVNLVSDDGWSVNTTALAEFLVHGLKYVFPGRRGGMGRGIPTGVAAPPLEREFRLGDGEIPVWPHPEGRARGYELIPLCPAVPQVCLADPGLYEWMALIDAIRAGRAREREMATKIVEKRLGRGHGH